MANLRYYRRGFATAPSGAVTWVESRALGDMDRLEEELSGRPFLAGAAPSIADLSASAYVFLAPEAGIDPARWPAVAAWLDRLRALGGWVEQYRLMAR
jgi:glutathione S-transferase